MTITHDALETGYLPRPSTCDLGTSSPPPCYRHLVVITGDLFKPPMVLTYSGDHRNMYGWQAGGTHPGILSCGNFFLRVIVTKMYDNTGQTIRGKQSKNFRVDRTVQSAHIINFLRDCLTVQRNTTCYHGRVKIFLTTERVFKFYCVILLNSTF